MASAPTTASTSPRKERAAIVCDSPVGRKEGGLLLPLRHVCALLLLLGVTRARYLLLLLLLRALLVLLPMQGPHRLLCCCVLLRALQRPWHFWAKVLLVELLLAQTQLVKALFVELLLLWCVLLQHLRWCQLLCLLRIWRKLLPVVHLLLALVELMLGLLRWGVLGVLLRHLRRCQLLYLLRIRQRLVPVELLLALVELVLGLLLWGVLLWHLRRCQLLCLLRTWQSLLWGELRGALEQACKLLIVRVPGVVIAAVLDLHSSWGWAHMRKLISNRRHHSSDD